MVSAFHDLDKNEELVVELEMASVPVFHKQLRSRNLR